MTDNRSSIAILGSTGSVGKQSVEVARLLNLKIDLLVSNSSVNTIEEQAREFKPRCCVLTDKNSAKALKEKLSDTKIQVFGGEDSLNEIILESKAKTAINAISGFAGLKPAISCAKSGKRIAMSNKEAIVIAYNLLKKEVDANHSELIPVDSEHSAIFQCLEGNRVNNIKRIVLKQLLTETQTQHS